MVLYSGRENLSNLSKIIYRGNGEWGIGSRDIGTKAIYVGNTIR
jgi:hypothetical protein